MHPFRMFVATLLVFAASSAFAQKNELAVLAGANFTSSRDFSVPLPLGAPGPSVGIGSYSFGHNVTYEAAYAHRFVDAKLFALSVEAPFVGATSISVKTSNATVLPPKDYSAFYFTPGLRLTAFSLAGISPWVSVGGGLARFGPSNKLLDGTLNPNSNANTTAAVQFGGGVDVKFLPHLALRGEVRDFYTGVPHLNDGSTSDRAHNVIVSGGLVFHF